MAEKITMKMIADKMNISVNAVSLALNNKRGVSEDMRLNVLRTAHELGYIDKKQKFQSTFRRANFCIMMQKMYHTDMYFYSKVLYAVVEESRANHYDSIMHFFHDQNMVIPDCIEAQRVAGIIIIGKISDDNLLRLLAYQIPVVLVDHASLYKPVNSIISDNKSGGYIAAKYLISKGFTRIGFFGDLDYSLSIKERFFGFREAIKELADSQDLVLEDYIHKYSITHNIEDAIINNRNEYIVEVLKNQEYLPEAYVCSNDFAAIAVCMAGRTLGIAVPEELSVVGFDDIDLCRMVQPQITTIKVNKSLMGKKAVRQMVQMLKRREAAVENIVMGVELIERESVYVRN